MPATVSLVLFGCFVILNSVHRSHLVRTLSMQRAGHEMFLAPMDRHIWIDPPWASYYTLFVTLTRLVGFVYIIYVAWRFGWGTGLILLVSAMAAVVITDAILTHLANNRKFAYVYVRWLSLFSFALIPIVAIGMWLTLALQ